MKKSIADSLYVAVDFELSGITSHPILRNSNLDTIETRYFKASSNAKHHSSLQLGICCFLDSPSSKSIECKAFNIDTLQVDPLFDTSTAAFLTANNFDFNACIYDRPASKSLTLEDVSAASLAVSTAEVKDGNLRIITTGLSADAVRLVTYAASEVKSKIEWKGRHLLCLTGFEGSVKKAILAIIAGTDQGRAGKDKKQELAEVVQGIRHKPLVFHNGFLDLLHVVSRVTSCATTTSNRCPKTLTVSESCAMTGLPGFTTPSSWPTLCTCFGTTKTRIPSWTNVSRP